MNGKEKTSVATTACEEITESKDFYKIAYKNGTVEDVIELVDPQKDKSGFSDYAYIFGYRFKTCVSSAERTEFLKWVKGLSEVKPTDTDIRHLVERPLGFLNKTVHLQEFGCVVYPRSNRSDLTVKIIGGLGKFLQPTTKYRTFELIKTLPQGIEFNREYFDAEYTGEIGDTRYTQIVSHVNDTLLPRIRSLDYFSISESVPAKYRRFLWKYLSFASPEQEEAFKALQNKKILVVDDINSTGSTLSEILKVIGVLKPDADVYVYTLIGKA